MKFLPACSATPIRRPREALERHFPDADLAGCSGIEPTATDSQAGERMPGRAGSDPTTACLPKMTARSHRSPESGEVVHAAKGPEQPHHSENDQKQADGAAETVVAVPIVTIVTAAAAKQQDQHDDDQDCTHDFHLFLWLLEPGINSVRTPRNLPRRNSQGATRGA